VGHGQQQTWLDYVICPQVAPGYEAATDLLTRLSEDYNFAGDASIRKAGIDPATDDRYLEEIVFEVKATQSESNLRVRVRELSRRGVRRIFAIYVQGDKQGRHITVGPVKEWSAATGDWLELDPDSVIKDRCLRAPLPVRALIDRVAADNAVARALSAKGNPAIKKIYEQGEKAGYEQGEKAGYSRALDGIRDILLMVFEARGLALDDAQRERIRVCSELSVLKQWHKRALHYGTATEVFDEPLASS
jgi:hypothetical protein